MVGGILDPSCLLKSYTNKHIRLLMVPPRIRQIDPFEGYQLALDWRYPLSVTIPKSDAWMALALSRSWGWTER